MAEYIEREKVLELGYWHGEHPTLDHPFLNGVDAVDAADIESIPSADVAPVVHGKWNYVHRHRGGFRTYVGVDRSGETHTITVDERMEIDEPYCSVCGKWNESTWLSYCPNCGAKMEGE